MYALECREHAEGCRRLAETVPYTELRGPFLALAETWDSLARNREAEPGNTEGVDGSALNEGVVRTLSVGRSKPRKGARRIGGRTHRPAQKTTA
jgi:hypothetical protein